ncbi:hypothetical protein [Gordonia polyisoprenivorans]|uniref:hypothetical protein n=1 Tax=Gordonia polyisoprenivorans TaxID=84595 RepID=UPI000B99E891|nr:hypothetical protein [Gordonia polyisoprenivorans]OZC32462.1 hypothetical protein CJJ17_13920 [Gordonia polyisoprenivorans]UZF55867.1 hypothetical protein LH935_24730 [Gordonia polyisoprenivorans]
MVSGFLIGSEQHRKHVLRKTGLFVVIAVVIVGVIFGYIVPALTPRDHSLMSVTIDAPAVGPGVEDGTEVVLRGAPIGKVTGLHVNSDGTSSITVDLERSLAQGMGQDFVVDFRPKNYFGITGISVVNPGDPAAGELTDGDHVTRRDIGDYTMSTMIEQGSDVANGTLMPDTMNAIKRVLVYTAAFQPLIHTGVVFADVVARTQQQTPAYLLDRYNDIVTALPPFADGALSAIDSFYNSALRPAGDEVQNNFTITLKAISDNFFSMVGRLLKSNQGNLTPLVDTITSAASVLPAVGEGVVTPVTVSDLVSRLDGAFTQGADGQQVLKIKLALQSLPAMAGPIAGLPTGGR